MAWQNDWEKRNLKQVSGIFDSPVELESLLIILEQHGCCDDVSILMSDHTRNSYSSFYQSDMDRMINTEFASHTGANFEVAEQSKAPEGATTGGITGGVLGAVIGGLTMVGSVFIPGASLLVSGPVIGALAGGAIGSAAGGLLGALAGAGIPEHEAKAFEKALQEVGKSLVVAHVPENRVPEVRKIFKQCGAHHIKVAS